MSEHAEHIAKLIAELRPLTEGEKLRLKALLAPAVAAVHEEDLRRAARAAASIPGGTRSTRKHPRADPKHRD